VLSVSSTRIAGISIVVLGHDHEIWELTRCKRVFVALGQPAKGRLVMARK